MRYYAEMNRRIAVMYLHHGDYTNAAFHMARWKTLSDKAI